MMGQTIKQVESADLTVLLTLQRTFKHTAQAKPAGCPNMAFLTQKNSAAEKNPAKNRGVRSIVGKLPENSKPLKPLYKKTETCQIGRLSQTVMGILAGP